MAVVCGFFNTFARNNQCPSSERAPPRRAASGFLCGGGGTAVVKISASSHLETSRRRLNFVLELYMLVMTRMGLLIRDKLNTSASYPANLHRSLVFEGRSILYLMHFTSCSLLFCRRFGHRAGQPLIFVK